jgi:hypothetical protein
MEAIFNTIKKNSPHSYVEFKSFLRKHYEGLFEFHRLTKDTMPYEMLLGFFVEFFHENHVEFNINSTNKESILDSIVDAFSRFERVIGHYS